MPRFSYVASVRDVIFYLTIHGTNHAAVEYDGEHQGGTNGTYVAAYVKVVDEQNGTLTRAIFRYKYFEKRRIFEGKEKSDDRRYNEGHWIMGIPIHVPGTHYFFLRDDLAADYGIDAFSD